MLTATKLARHCGISRTALLYCESIGLIRKPARTGGNCRCYGQADVERLLQIRAYRNAGLKLDDICAIFATRARQTDARKVLERRLVELDAEIGCLRAHQQAILRLLGHKALGKAEMITKEKWVSTHYNAIVTALVSR
jgi:DNA-binding transcriptional MerR regulator